MHRLSNPRAPRGQQNTQHRGGEFSISNFSVMGMNGDVWGVNEDYRAIKSALIAPFELSSGHVVGSMERGAVALYSIASYNYTRRES